MMPAGVVFVAAALPAARCVMCCFAAGGYVFHVVAFGNVGLMLHLRINRGNNPLARQQVCRHAVYAAANRPCGGDVSGCDSSALPVQREKRRPEEKLRGRRFDMFHYKGLVLLFSVLYGEVSSFQCQLVFCQFFNDKGVCERTCCVIANAFA